jgi:CAAX protease family protein
MHFPEHQHTSETPEAETGSLVHPVPPEENLHSGPRFPPAHPPESVQPGAPKPPIEDSPLGWADLVYLLVFYVVSGALLALLVGAAAMVIFHIPFSALQNLSGAGASVEIVSQGLLSFATLAFLYVMVRAHSAAPFWPAVGWRRFRGVASRGAAIMGYVLLGFGLALGVSWASRYVDTGKTLPMEELFHNRQTVVLLILLGILVAPLIEETIFRGCLYPVIARRFGVPAGIVATGVVFGLAHAPQLWGGWGQIALLMGVGIVLTYIRARAGTVAASYFVHVSYNTILFVGLYFATGGLRHFPTT